MPKIYTNKALLDDCIDLLRAYSTGDRDCIHFDDNAEKLIKDIEYKYPDLDNSWSKKDYEIL